MTPRILSPSTTYTVGVMSINPEGKQPQFHQLVQDATDELRETLTHDLDLEVTLSALKVRTSFQPAARIRA